MRKSRGEAHTVFGVLHKPYIQQGRRRELQHYITIGWEKEPVRADKG